MFRKPLELKLKVCKSITYPLWWCTEAKIQKLCLCSINDWPYWDWYTGLCKNIHSIPQYYHEDDNWGQIMSDVLQSPQCTSRVTKTKETKEKLCCHNFIFFYSFNWTFGHFRRLYCVEITDKVFIALIMKAWSLYF